MATVALAGYGSGSFGTFPFGTAEPGDVPLELLSILAVRENVVRITFNVAPRYTQLLDPNDASDARRYLMEPVAGTEGRDGEPTRPVGVIVVELVDGFDGTVLDIIIDRPMSPEPGKYNLTISGLVSDVGEVPLDDTIVEVTALFKGIVPLIPEFIINNRDIANPQTRQGIFDPLPVTEGQELDPILGTFPEDSQGDVAFDEGLAGFKKRVMRRLTTRRGKFAHLPNYGVSTLTSLKQLARPGIRETLADEAEQQILQEPETQSVSVELVIGDRPEVTVYRVRVRTNFGQMPDMDVPLSFSPTGI